MLSIPKYPEQYAQHFPTIFYLLCCASQHHVHPMMRMCFFVSYVVKYTKVLMSCIAGPILFISVHIQVVS